MERLSMSLRKETSREQRDAWTCFVADLAGYNLTGNFRDDG